LALSTAIAMVIAAFSVYVLAADTVQRRTKEIALRKLFGTRRRDIGKLVAKEVGAIILLSAVVAMPPAALAIGRYLAAYTQQTPNAFWSLGIALVAALATAAFGKRISASDVEGTVNRLIGRRMCKSQYMCWSKRGAHLLLQVRCAVLNGDLLAGFRRWFPTVGERRIMLPWDWLPQQ
jgi:hypothetical protein